LKVLYRQWDYEESYNMAYLDETGLKGFAGIIKNRLDGKVDKSQGTAKAG